MNDEQAIKITEEFFRRRFPKKDIEFEKKCGYFGEWIHRLRNAGSEGFMDGESLQAWNDMQPFVRHVCIETAEVNT